MPDKKSIVAALMPMMVMEKRSKSLKKIEAASRRPQSGGMFDFIYKKRKEREKSISEIEG